MSGWSILAPSLGILPQEFTFSRDRAWASVIKCGSKNSTTQRQERAHRTGLGKRRKLIGYPGPGKGV